MTIATATAPAPTPATAPATPTKKAPPEEFFVMSCLCALAGIFCGFMATNAPITKGYVCEQPNVRVDVHVSMVNDHHLVTTSACHSKEEGRDVAWTVRHESHPVEAIWCGLAIFFDLVAIVAFLCYASLVVGGGERALEVAAKNKKE